MWQQVLKRDGFDVNDQATDMRIVVLGCGNIGSVIANDLAQSLNSAEVVMADVDSRRAKNAAKIAGKANVTWTTLDASNLRQLIRSLKNFDMSVCALPGSIGYRACRGAVSAGVDMVDVSYMPEDIMKLSKSALEAGVCIVPDCGMSPGLSNILIGHAVSKLDKVESVQILNGGLPAKPVSPLGYVITWSVEDLMDMYMRKVTVVRNGKVLKVEALSGLEKLAFPSLGELEAFFTDGLRTLLRTVKANEMWEKTLRFSGHIEKIKLLKSLGFFDSEPVEVEGLNVSPRKVTSRLFERKLRMPNVPDLVVMKVEVKGIKCNKQAEFTYQMFDLYDEKRNVTAMARTTAYTTSIVAQLVAEKTVKEKGITPPERLGMNKRFFEKFMSAIRKRGIEIGESGTRKVLSK